MNKAGGSGSKFNYEDQIDRRRREQHRKHQLKYRRSRRKCCKPITNAVYISRNIDNITSDSEVENIENEHIIYNNNDSTDNINISSEEVDKYLSTHVIRSYDAHNMDELQLSDDEQYFSNVTRGNSDSEEEIDNNALSIANFIRKSNLNHSDTTHLLQLLRTIRFDEEIPRTENDLWNKLGVEFNFQSFVFCTSCSAKLVKFSDWCNCAASFKKINSELIVFSVSSALTNIIKQNIDLIDWYRQEDNQIVPDIVKGSVFKKKRRNNSITILISTDGKPTLKSSQSSIWPILGSIVEIPPPVREFQDNIMLFALWHSPNAPNANVFITDVINQIVQLQKNGLSIDLAAKGIRIFEIDVQLLVGDLPARAKLTRLNGHSGYFACSNCLYEGVSCPYHRHTLYTWSNFCAAKPSVRTQEHIDWCAMRGEVSNKKVYGVHEASPLSRIMSIPIQCVYDYFHLIFEIHLTMLVKKWKLRLTQVNINYINKLLNDVSYPHSFNRKPKNFNLFNQWKASELRTFFLYLALPTIIRAQPALSDKIIYHFSLLFIYVRILRYFDDRYQIHDMKIFIEKYLQMFSTIYGQCHELLSTHVLIHLTEQCTRHGGLSYHSMFTFESQLHYLRKMAHGTTSLAQQIAFWYTIDKKLNTKKKYSVDLLTKQELRRDIFFDNNIRILYQQAFQNACHLFFGLHIDHVVEYISRFGSGLKMYHSLAYLRKRSTASHRVCVPNPRCTKKICFGEIIFFFSYRQENFLLLKQYRCSLRTFSSFISYENCLESWSDYINRFYHIIESSSFHFVILPCTSIVNKCLFIPFSDTDFVCTEIEHELEHD
ncbi:unnamed protein product [Rotaria sp. Silwood2]|nr:unnamed protein product [Rotaria sp. Silwood2]CAF2962344.1 unnamed protein product [Rotaria sp. Silwood2]CAF3345618.1 unnamed protein product [Rotaria sp. Silwood2]CAF4155439.1 unnamed protein product [Rotaria sp. Silwood2]CAF4255926.1 unnamed protein product [Rotaria sp. Silwood2]